MRTSSCSWIIRGRSHDWPKNPSPARYCAASRRRCCANWGTRWRWRGPAALNGTAYAGLVLSGQTLLDIAHDDYSDPLTLQQAKALMRLLISHRLEQKPLNSRRIFEELRQL